MATPSSSSRFETWLEGLGDEELLELHKVVSRRAAIVYAARHADHHAAGVTAARDRTTPAREPRRAGSEISRRRQDAL